MVDCEAEIGESLSNLRLFLKLVHELSEIKHKPAVGIAEINIKLPKHRFPFPHPSQSPKNRYLTSILVFTGSKQVASPPPFPQTFPSFPN
jgi:hypothetical protein